jgi:phosphoribosylglycinamide formyltransferase 1
VLASGSGTNLQALLNVAGIKSQIAVVVSDRPDAGALTRASSAGIPTAVVRYRDYPDRASFSMAVADVIEASGAKGVVLAGFMRILSPEFIARFPDRILNVHPSLLPAFPGARAVEDALAHGVRVTGVTVHFVDEQVDHGPVIAQVPVEVEEGDDARSLHRRIQTVEHDLYPRVVQAFLAGDIYVVDGRVVWE